MMQSRQARGRRSQARGLVAESLAVSALERDGWHILARRLRNAGGEIDILAQKAGLLSIVEVKARRDLAGAAGAITLRQKQRLVAAADQVLADHPDWGPEGTRFDILVVDAANRVRRIANAFVGGMLE
ncbi:MAG: YraN family protein [Rhodospirillales bacterium]|nr:YraN family protein [Rhodospirillales bacterium]